MIEIIKAAFFAGEVKTFLIQGEYLEILEAAYPIGVSMLDRSGAQLSVMRNAEASYFSRPGRYEVVQVTSQLAQTVRIFVGSGDAGTRKTSGDVSVIDGGKTRTIAGKAFIADVISEPLAANQSYVQLFNPVASGKMLIVDSINCGSTTNGYIEFRTLAASLSTLGPAPVSKNIALASAASVAKTYKEQSGATIGARIFALYVSANVEIENRFKEPIVIQPGYGLILGGPVNQSVMATFQFLEESI